MTIGSAKKPAIRTRHELSGASRTTPLDEDLSVPLDNHRTLWLTEISRATFDDQALDELGGDGGLFIVLEDCAQGTFEVLAKAASTFAGASLLNLLAASLPGVAGEVEDVHNPNPSANRLGRPCVDQDI